MGGTFMVSLDYELFWGMLDVCPLEAYQDNVLGGRKSHTYHAGGGRNALFPVSLESFEQGFNDTFHSGDKSAVNVAFRYEGIFCASCGIGAAKGQQA